MLTYSYNAAGPNHFDIGQFRSTTADGAHGLGWADNGSEVKVAYTFYGDSTLDGTVDISDLGDVLANYNKTGMTWSQGDYNYDGTVNNLDLGSILTNYNKSLPAPGISGMSYGGLDAQAIGMLTAAGFSVGVVPEPSTLVLLAAGLLGLVCYAWRRRRS